MPLHLGQGTTVLIQKGKKNCPLCRRTFNSVLKVHRKRFLKANGTTYDKEECEEIKNEDIKARPAVKDLKAMIPGPFQFLLGMNENQALVMTGMAVVVPPWPLWSQMLLSTMHFPLMPLAL